LKRIDIQEAAAGDIVLAGIEDITIGETITDMEHQIAIPPIAIDEPTVSMVFDVNTSPMADRDGQCVTSRQLRDRLDRERSATSRSPRADRLTRTGQDLGRASCSVDSHRDDAARRLRAAGVATGHRHKEIKGAIVEPVEG
jgi:GTP-binding protein